MAARWLRSCWSRWRRGDAPRAAAHPRQPRQRIVRYFDCTWPSAWREERARASSLSPTGCYIESRFTVPAIGTAIRDLTVTLPSGTVVLQGIVIEAMRGIGFAVRFTDVDPETRSRLSALVQDAGTDPVPPGAPPEDPAPVPRRPEA